MRVFLFILGSMGDAGWMMLGFIAWVVTLCAADIHIENAITKRSFHFPGWAK